MANPSILRSALIVILIMAFCYSLTYSQESGWEEHTGYSIQKLKIPNLLSLYHSPSGDKFYTYHSPNMVYIWETLSGNLIDSIVITNTIDDLFFSKDGTSIVLSSYINKDSREISILDIETHKRILNTSLSFLEVFDYNLDRESQTIWVDDYINITFLDYNKELNQLLVGDSFGFSYGESEIIPWYAIYYFTLGALGRFEIKGDSLHLIEQITNNTTYDFFEDDKDYYLTEYISTKELSSSNGSNSQRIDKNCKNNLTYKFKDSLDNKHIAYSELQIIESRISGESTSWTKGEYKPYSKIFAKEEQNKLYVKCTNQYYVVDRASKSIVDSFAVGVNSKMEQVNNKFQYLVSLDTNMFYYYNLDSLTLTDSLQAPILPSSFVLMPKTDIIIAWHGDGTIIKKLPPVSTLVRNDNPNEPGIIHVYPNPASDAAHIDLPSGINAGKIMVYNIFGREVMSGELTKSCELGFCRFHLIGLDNGIYLYKIISDSKTFSGRFVVSR